MEGADEEQLAWDALSVDGATVLPERVYARVEGFKLRVYDGAVRIDGKWYGIETKARTATRNPDQTKFDNWLRMPGNSVETPDGILLEGVFDVWVP
ncbi:hypothetical protein [Actinoallomurus acaciae]|uniref:Uncharacterized protein n=1 Tax=Actinoallomurus acaciae TaxID=502577 RepID=A0ABV5YCC1_9ACTN